MFYSSNAVKLYLLVLDVLFNVSNYGVCFQGEWLASSNDGFPRG
jgi:hypothetical protein